MILIIFTFKYSLIEKKLFMQNRLYALQNFKFENFNFINGFQLKAFKTPNSYQIDTIKMYEIRGTGTRLTFSVK